VDKELQVQHLMDSVIHPPYKHILADVLCAHLEAKKSLSLAMGLVTTKTTYYSIVLGKVSTLTAGTTAGASELHSIWKLK